MWRGSPPGSRETTTSNVFAPEQIVLRLRREQVEVERVPAAP